jgi:Pyrimidine dimer DNA glycosylase
MRLWSLHPRYLDPAGLVAVWREGLLAQAVLRGETRGYTRHPQLVRFREEANPRGAIAGYLARIADEAESRGYAFDRRKIRSRAVHSRIAVTRGQLLFEWSHLRAKLERRNAGWYAAVAHVKVPRAHPSFTIVRGCIASWERP